MWLFILSPVALDVFHFPCCGISGAANSSFDVTLLLRPEKFQGRGLFPLGLETRTLYIARQCYIVLRLSTHGIASLDPLSTGMLQHGAKAARRGGADWASTNLIIVNGFGGPAWLCQAEEDFCDRGRWVSSGATASMGSISQHPAFSHCLLSPSPPSSTSAAHSPASHHVGFESIQVSPFKVFRLQLQHKLSHSPPQVLLDVCNLFLTI